MKGERSNGHSQVSWEKMIGTRFPGKTGISGKSHVLIS